MICPYCNKPAELVTGDVIYPHRRDLREKRFYLCQSCEAYVGCHGDTDKPLGRLANAELRAAKIAAHEAFDPLWQSGSMSRTQAYRWLAAKLRITPKQCHIGEFTVEQCREVVAVCGRQKAAQ